MRERNNTELYDIVKVKYSMVNKLRLVSYNLKGTNLGIIEKEV